MPARPAPAIADRIDAALPQHQCRRCGYDACRPYAEAVACGEAINRCPPGGESVIAALAALTGRPTIALDPACGAPSPHAVARVDEGWCIGCTLCIDACPVDAIVGAAKRMHAVLPSLCTGCELCIAPCPVDCISMVPAGRAWSVEDAIAGGHRYRSGERRSSPPSKRAPLAAPGDDSLPTAGAAASRRKAAVDAALARARSRRAAAGASRR